MLRRLYFVLPNVSVLSQITTELKQVGIDTRHISVATRQPDKLRDLDLRVQNSTHDTGATIERVLWSGNLILFFVATLVAVALALSFGLNRWLLLPLAVMLATFIAGLWFTRVPNTHILEFADALRHGELLLMVDVPRNRVADVENLVHHRHPEATVGGVGWASDLLHV